MEELYRMIEDKIYASGYEGKVSGEEIYDEICDEIEDKEEGSYIFMSKKEDDTIYEYKIDVMEEAKYDGLYAVCTNLEDSVEDIIKVNHRRWEIEESFRIMKSEFEARPVYLSREDRIKAHFITCFLALVIYFIYVIIKCIRLNVAIQAFQAIILLILFFSGIQIILIGIMGEYLGRIFNESKHRPLYLVNEYNGEKEMNDK